MAGAQRTTAPSSAETRCSIKLSAEEEDSMRSPSSSIIMIGAGLFSNSPRSRDIIHFASFSAFTRMVISEKVQANCLGAGWYALTTKCLPVALLKFSNAIGSPDSATRPYVSIQYGSVPGMTSSTVLPMISLANRPVIFSNAEFTARNR
ncbi:hypothetical protein SDC9_193922 [bioreactor metagenome]|uniref:Uncharacterized protein n=1 Tax=bioreactor metagenome TaxID=1076179 RepID=A0A645I618_9ZZZZ